MHQALLQSGLAFNDYARNVREANVGFLVTEAGRNDWSVRNCIVGKSVLQFGRAGAGTIADGVMTQPDVMVFVFQSSPAPHRVHMNGERVAAQGIAALAPGSDFVFANQVRHEWISLSVRLDRFPRRLLDRLDENIDLRSAALLVPERDAFAELIRLAAAAGKPRWAIGNATPVDSATDDDELINALTTAVATSERIRAGRRRRDESHYRHIVRHALAAMPDHARVRLDDLRQASGFKERTLRRAFNNVFKMPPLRYLKFRRLNQVHAALCDAEARGELVTDILTRYGVTELGRFATEYRALFGASPSQTIRRRFLAPL